MQFLEDKELQHHKFLIDKFKTRNKRKILNGDFIGDIKPLRIAHQNFPQAGSLLIIGDSYILRKYFLYPSRHCLNDIFCGDTGISTLTSS